MMPHQASKFSSMISSLLEMHTSKRPGGLVGDPCDARDRQHLFGSALHRFRDVIFNG